VVEGTGLGLDGVVTEVGVVEVAVVVGEGAADRAASVAVGVLPAAGCSA
jgi:hypothetical protein